MLLGLAHWAELHVGMPGRNGARRGGGGAGRMAPGRPEVGPSAVIQKCEVEWTCAKL